MSDRYYTYTFSPALYDMDAAGVMFFGHLFRHLHDAYEAFMAHIGHPLPAILEEGRYLLPIVQTGADYHRPLLQGRRLRIELHLETLTASEFRVAYLVTDESGEELASARTVHACIDPRERRRRPLPESLRNALQEFLR